MIAKIAYSQGIKAALAKFGSMLPTVSSEGQSSAIDQAFQMNASLGPTSSMEEPPNLNAILQGGPPLAPHPTDAMGGVNQLQDTVVP